MVASSRTYLEPPRRIKARPTGLRLERSLVPVPLPALRTIYYSPLFSASIPVADFILRRRPFPNAYAVSPFLETELADRFEKF